jgi:multidrug resistance efflux pump
MQPGTGTSAPSPQATLTDREHAAQAELQLARAAEASARASQAGIAATNASTQAKLANARATLDLAHAQEGATWPRNFCKLAASPRLAPAIGRRPQQLS